MAERPRKQRHRPSAESETPRIVVPSVKPPKPPNPNDLEDMRLAPGDPVIKAAYDRVGKKTGVLTGTLGAAIQDVDGSDALMIHKLAKRSRVMTFQVQGIIWKAGFSKQLIQTPMGAALNLNDLPKQEFKAAGTIIKPVEPSLEAVLRELIPSVLVAAGNKMYGHTRELLHLSLFMVPREDGAITGMIAHYGDGPTSRSHYLYLQTSVRRADPIILEQVHQTFVAALPMTQKTVTPTTPRDFWQELERSLYQVKATYRTSALHEGKENLKAQLTAGFQKTGNQMDKAMLKMDKFADRAEWLLGLPVRGLIWVIQGASNLLVGMIQGFDRMAKRRKT